MVARSGVFLTRIMEISIALLLLWVQACSLFGLLTTGLIHLITTTPCGMIWNVIFHLALFAKTHLETDGQSI